MRARSWLWRNLGDTAGQEGMVSVVEGVAPRLPLTRRQGEILGEPAMALFELGAPIPNGCGS